MFTSYLNVCLLFYLCFILQCNLLNITGDSQSKNMSETMFVRNVSFFSVLYQKREKLSVSNLSISPVLYQK